MEVLMLKGSHHLISPMLMLCHFAYILPSPFSCSVLDRVPMGCKRVAKGFVPATRTVHHGVTDWDWGQGGWAGRPRRESRSEIVKLGRSVIATRQTQRCVFEQAAATHGPIVPAEINTN